MPVHRWLIPMSAVTLMATACTSYSQAPQLELAARPARPGLESIGSETTTLQVGPKGMEVPIQITWTRLQDKGCVRVGAIQVKRTGGPEGVQVEVRIRYGGAGDSCVTDLNPEPGAPEVRFDETVVQFAWKARRGIKSFESSGHPVLLHGNGRAQVADNVVD
ncbi:hypothetical protein D7Y15_41905 [Corallococcus sp. AB030]|nr:hypothetical protein [Corallococcus sp. AB030]RKH95576.1 hypothetical protein D7Y15_41905 [Corallococcus sp. AB030]